ncbi:protein of unknown function [Candidatus Methylacidiphilum fumarolicum]|uniref:Uncharacterized protein n=1 Tax=Candidatus Methylacidiphilum fumarolicum TaxID=591154 RepID=A0ABM9IBT8_9BACT|nr:protein of unknown function [Candidatus Methylacidiphilum fumarolicum]
MEALGKAAGVLGDGMLAKGDASTRETHPVGILAEPGGPTAALRGTERNQVGIG